MRSRFLAIPFAIAFAFASVGLVAADTGGGGGSDYAEGGIDVAITSASVDPKSGLVSVSGHITCDVDFDYVGVDIQLSQLVGRLNTLRGYGFAEMACTAADGSATFTMALSADSGRFAPGAAKIQVSAWGQGGCHEDPDEGYVCDTYGSASHPMSLRLGRTR